METARWTLNSLKSLLCSITCWNLFCILIQQTATHPHSWKIHEVIIRENYTGEDIKQDAMKGKVPYWQRMSGWKSVYWTLRIPCPVVRHQAYFSHIGDWKILSWRNWAAKEKGSIDADMEWGNKVAGSPFQLSYSETYQSIIPCHIYRTFS